LNQREQDLNVNVIEFKLSLFLHSLVLKSLRGTTKFTVPPIKCFQGRWGNRRTDPSQCLLKVSKHTTNHEGEQSSHPIQLHFIDHLSSIGLMSSGFISLSISGVRSI